MGEIKGKIREIRERANDVGKSVADGGSASAERDKTRTRTKERE